MLKLFDSTPSGNAFKIRLLLAQLGREYERVEINVTDIAKRDQRPAEMLRGNPNARVPALILEDGRMLAESNAILCYLARGTAQLPDDPYDHARTLQWLFFEQNHHEPYIAVARYLVNYVDGERRFPDRLELLRQSGNRALQVMETHLAEHDYFAADRYTIADNALFAYTHTSGEGGFDLARYPKVSAWLRRVEAQPGFVAMKPDA
ncbi:MAG: glutathione S-transferase family protein [Planctomycetota bacterium]